MRMRRKKIKIEKIEDISARQVTFSKRRQGLVKKASELSILCDAEVAVTVISPAGRLHQYSSCNIKDILDKFSLYSEAEQHQVRSQEEKRNYFSLSRGVEDKINYLRLITSENLQHFSPEELQKLETKLEARLQSVTAKKNTLAAGTIRTQIEKANKSARRIPEANTEGSSFQFSTERWVPPPPNTYKVNFAGANFQDMHASGVGIVIRNWGGVFMAAFARFFPGLMDLKTISLMAAKCAVEFSVDYHFTHIVLEGDDENTVNEVKNTHDTQSLTSSGNLQEVMSYIRQLGGCFLSHVQRSGNDAAHMVAQYARNVGDEIVWLMEEPDFLAHILLADVSQ